MRVVAGIARGRQLKAPPGRHLRPTTERVREAMFSSLESLGAVRGATVVDFFAGTGALGIEALSRGAASVVFVDADHVAMSVVKANLASLGLEGATTVLTDAIRFAGQTAPFDLALVAPPYAFDEWDRLLGVLPAKLAALEWGRVVILPDGWKHVKTLRHGDSVVTVARRREAPPGRVIQGSGIQGSGIQGSGIQGSGIQAVELQGPTIREPDLMAEGAEQ